MRILFKINKLTRSASLPNPAARKSEAPKCQSHRQISTAGLGKTQNKTQTKTAESKTLSHG